MNFIRTIIMILFLIWQSGYSQQILNLPLKWQKPRWFKTIDTTSNSNKAWIVFSDRDINPTYESPKSKTVKKTINYLDDFYVTAVEGSYLHIYKDDSKAASFKQLGPNKEDYGWIKIDYLLPNMYCYMNDEEGSMKAILSNTALTAKGDVNEIKEKDFQKVRFYKDPQLTQPNDYECNIYQVFYIYKRFLPYYPFKALLLGKNPKFSPSDKDNIVGWVDINRLAIWDNRIALLPNTQPEAIKERLSLKEFASVYNSSEAVKLFSENKNLINEEMVLWSSDSCWGTERYSSYSIRFPVLSVKKESQTTSEILQLIVPINLNSTADFSSGVKSYLSGLGLSTNEMEILNRSKSTLFIPGFTNLKTKGHTYPFWEKQVLLSGDEFYTILKGLESINERSSSETELRENITRYFINMVRFRSFEEKQAMGIENLTVEEVETITIGLPGPSNLLNFKIIEIKDTKKVSYGELKVFIEEMNLKYRRLKSIYEGATQDSKNYIWESNDSRFFWIPQRLLP